MAQPICFTESTYYACDRYPDLISALADFPDICGIGNHSFQFRIVGAFCIDEQPIVVFPKNYGLENNDAFSIQEARTLTRALIRYRNETQSENNETALLYGNNSISSNRIASAAVLLEDYCQNGFIKRQEEVSSQNYAGRTDWVATINRIDPIFSKRMPVYPDPIVRRKKPDPNNIVCIAHRYVINDCFKEWGWLFNYDNFVESAEILPFPVPEVILRLQAELRKTYLEREILVIRHLIQYLKAKSGNESNRQLDIIATQYFAFVWEAMCGYLFSNRYAQLKELLPQPVWESDIVNGSIAQRPDIFMVNEDALFILDAKYYNYHHNIPGWHDVVKQLFYRHTMVSIKDSREYHRLLPNAREIYNAFILPGEMEGISYLGRVHVPRVEDLGEIKVFAVNQKKALAAYAYRDNDVFVQAVQRGLISQI